MDGVNEEGDYPAQFLMRFEGGNAQRRRARLANACSARRGEGAGWMRGIPAGRVFAPALSGANERREQKRVFLPFLRKNILRGTPRGLPRGERRNRHTAVHLPQAENA